MTIRMTGHDAITYAQAQGRTLSTHTDSTAEGREGVVGDLVVYNRKLHRVVRLERQQREDGLSARTAWFDTGIGMTAPDDESFHIVERSAAEVAS